MMKGSSIAREKMMANDFCVKEIATEHLKEKTKCAPKANLYVDYIFDKCKLDTAPYNKSKNGNLKSFTDIM